MTAEPAAVPATRPTLKQRLKLHLAQYGKIALYTYLSISLLAITGFSIAIGLGVTPSSASGVLGVIGAGWVAAKATVPLRILATLAITPLIATLLQRRRAHAPEPAPDDDA